MITNLPDTLLRYRIVLGILALIVCAATWALDLTELVYECPFCRAQRTVIGLLGLIILLPWYRHWLSRYLAAIFAVFGESLSISALIRSSLMRSPPSARCGSLSVRGLRGLYHIGS